MRQRISFSFEVASSPAPPHSSLAQTSDRHQSPDARQGPAAQTISTRTLLDIFELRVLIRAGRPCTVCTSAVHGGRKIRKPVTGSADIIPAVSAKRESFFALRRIF